VSSRNSTVWACVLVATLGAPIGCTTKRDGAEQRQQTSGRSESTTPSDAGRGPSAAPEHAVTDTASSVAELFSRIHEHESHLSQIIAAGRLNELEADAAEISELLATAVRLAQVPRDQRTEFDGYVAEAKKAADALGRAGKAGNLEESKALNSDLQKALGIVERFVARPGA